MAYVKLQIRKTVGSTTTAETLPLFGKSYFTDDSAPAALIAYSGIGLVCSRWVPRGRGWDVVGLTAEGLELGLHVELSMMDKDGVVGGHMLPDHGAKVVLCPPPSFAGLTPEAEALVQDWLGNADQGLGRWAAAA